MINTYKLLLSSALALLSPHIYAATITYTIEGNLELAAGTDIFNLDGAHYKWLITADSESSNIGTYYLAPNGDSAHYLATSSMVEFTNRSNGATDALSFGTAPTLRADNYYSSSTTDYDQFEINHSYLSGMFEGLTVTTYYVGFETNFYQDDGIAQLPSSFDFDSALISGWGRFTYSNEITELARYYPTDWTMTVTTVPLPNSIWLFISGIAALTFVRNKPIFKDT